MPRLVTLSKGLPRLASRQSRKTGGRNERHARRLLCEESAFCQKFQGLKALLAESEQDDELRQAVRTLTEFSGQNPRSVPEPPKILLADSYQIARSSGVFPAASASTNQWGLRPLPDQVRAGFSGCWYFACAGARVFFTSTP